MLSWAGIEPRNTGSLVNVIIHYANKPVPYSYLSLAVHTPGEDSLLKDKTRAKTRYQVSAWQINTLTADATCVEVPTLMAREGLVAVRMPRILGRYCSFREMQDRRLHTNCDLQELQGYHCDDAPLFCSLCSTWRGDRGPYTSSV